MLQLYLFVECFKVRLDDVFLLDLFFCQFHVNFAGQLLDYELLLVQAKVLGGCGYELLPSPYNLPVKRINDGIAFFEKSVDPADLL
jgi:hypothetical protein